MAAKVPNMKLLNGVMMPMFGLGTWKSKPGEVVAAVKHAIAAGYRHIDCALIYQNEDEVGEAIKAKIEDGTVTRQQLFITTKCWNNYHSAAGARKCLLASLKSLGLDYVDLYLIHWPMAYQEGGELVPTNPKDGKIISSDIDYLETWGAFEDFYKEGLVKSIGLSNFNSEQITRILEKCKVKPMMNQVEIHPYFTNSKLVEFCESKGIGVTAYSPLGSPDRPWATKDDPQLLQDPKLKAVADKYKKTPAQVLIRFALQRNLVVIPKSVTAARIDENFDVFDFELTPEDMKTVFSFDRPDGRALLLPWVNHVKYYPFDIEF